MCRWGLDLHLQCRMVSSLPHLHQCGIMRHWLSGWLLSPNKSKISLARRRAVLRDGFRIRPRRHSFVRLLLCAFAADFEKILSLALSLAECRRHRRALLCALPARRAVRAAVSATAIRSGFSRPRRCEKVTPPPRHSVLLGMLDESNNTAHTLSLSLSLSNHSS